MTPEAFAQSLAAAEPPAGLPLALAALWHAARGGWNQAHAIVQAHEGTPDCDWVHAHLHRIEGDAANAAYWYRRAGRPVAAGAQDAERTDILAALIRTG
ncbi:hypothetical protein [Roseomonas rosulenta]|uniref:hypothetical protein n=1 Tax=Roseomonas rosulenta TaxID=2748667 RepID=UPI0018DFF647|nr:hypothetical protein [Roseomonas rosulenta]